MKYWKQKHQLFLWNPLLLFFCLMSILWLSPLVDTYAQTPQVDSNYIRKESWRINRSTGEMYHHAYEDRSFNDQGQLIKAQHFREEDGAFFLFIDQDYSYPDHQSSTVVTRDWIGYPSEKLITTKNRYAGKCLVYEEELSDSGDNERLSKTWFDSLSCKSLRQETFSRNERILPGFHPRYTRVWSYFDREEYFEEYQHENRDSILTKVFDTYRLFNDDGYILLERNNYYQPLAPTDSAVYFYVDSGLVRYEQYFWHQDQWNLYQEVDRTLSDNAHVDINRTYDVFHGGPSRTTLYSWQKFYDDEGKLIRRIHETGNILDDTPTQLRRFVWEYTYDCESRLVQRKVTNPGYISFEKYFYPDSNEDCKTLATGAGGDLLMKIFPNPGQQSIYIESDLLLQPSARIRLFTLAGKLVREWKPQVGFSRRRVVGPEIPAGKYIVRLETEKEVVVDKLIKY